MKLETASRVFAGVFWLVQESSSSSSQLRRRRDDSNTKKCISNNSTRLLQSTVTTILHFVLKSIAMIIAIIITFFALYYFAASPPLHLFYDVAPPAGPASVYLPVRFSIASWHRSSNSIDVYCIIHTVPRRRIVLNLVIIHVSL
jgi:hypothetical protein